MSTIEKEIYDLAGEEFNIMSPQQLADILFVKLGIPYPKRVKNNKYSTSKDILDKIRFVNPIVDKVLEYRMLSKLYSNYAVGLLSEIRDDGRIHTIFTQTLTRTGRLSSISPNLQNIPAWVFWLCPSSAVLMPCSTLLSAEPAGAPSTMGGPSSG